MNIKRTCEGQIFSNNHIYRVKNNNNNENWFDIGLVIKEAYIVILLPLKSIDIMSLIPVRAQKQSFLSRLNPGIDSEKLE
jgi:hypothetical protein